ncbi:fungal transcriptional regulatory protein [Hortaea werneckii]|nr:fungal transcriptional regulatory protein [Hortaea werneckii]KAI7060481.1 fungal transcriptional regulatory protein [Hortaea werneckii]KAI7206548.1 fungal transcriptional regulatory protein [Hortaea werneckii]KAI7294318.1 fungal transcriptional regulatory protein [Hortaea werneckii]KAI7379741.1 fungal transcriptional regulatory protein [Hortaea werneckii]
MAPRKIIIDTDPGVDDMLAMLLACSCLPEELEVLLLSITYGNIDVQNCIRNAISMFYHIEKEIAWRKSQGKPIGFDTIRKTKPVVAVGPEHPLADDMLMADYFHGRDGLGGIHESHPHLSPDDTWKSVLSAAKKSDDPAMSEIADELAKKDALFSPSHKPAHQEILRLLRENEPDTVTIVAIGPLTNLALAASEDPEAFLRVKEVVVMGGTINEPGNITPEGEFNTFADPVAAARVYALTSPNPFTTMPPTPPAPPGAKEGEHPPPYLASYPQKLSRQLKVTMFPLDITERHLIKRGEYRKTMEPVLASGSPLAEWTTAFLNATFDKVESLQSKVSGDEVGLQLHDPLCVWYCMIKAGEAGWKVNVDEDIRIETSGQWTRGMCVVDRRSRRKREDDDVGERAGDTRLGWLKMDHEYAALANLAGQVQQHQQQDFQHAPPPPQPQQHLDDGSVTGGKRKAEDGQTQQRAKRNRYISIACNECKRRKIKCNGQTPCQRCGNLNLECVYAPNCCNGFKDSHEYKEMQGHVASLQDQISMLYHDLSSLRSQLGQPPPPPIQQHVQQPQQQQPPPQPMMQQPPQQTPPQQHFVHHQQPQTQQQSHTPIDPSLQNAPFPSHRGSYSMQQSDPGAAIAHLSPSTQRPKSQSQSQQPSFRGPTSDEFNFGVAKSSLQTMGITSGPEDGGSGTAGFTTGDPSPAQSPPPRDRNSAQYSLSTHAQKDPIWSVSQEEAIRLCHVYEDEMGMMYPILDSNKMIAYAQKLYRFMEAAHRSGLMQQGMPGPDAIDDEDANILKMVLATAMTVESQGRSDLGRRLFECVQPAIDNSLHGNVDLKGVKLLVLAATYEFQRDNEGTAWRIIGLTARLCIELGLHRRETYEAMSDESDRDETILLFWSIYVLDRRWSFGTGMPFALQDSDIDPQLPKPEEKSPYLMAMINYSAIGSKVWHTVATAPSTEGGPLINTEEMNYLDYQVIQWHRTIPVFLRFEHPAQVGRLSTPIGPAPSRAGHRLRILIYLRANQMRILIYRTVLHSATSIIRYREQAQTVVDVAKDTVRVLTHINHTTDLYRTQQMLFNPFLTSALAVLFLAVSHTPALFAEQVKEEFYMALELIRGFSKDSWIGKRLWRTIRVLKEVGPKLGLAAKDSSGVAHQQPPASEQAQDRPHSSSHQQDQAGSKDDLDRSAAVAMAGLAGHNVDEMAGVFNMDSHQWSVGSGASISPEGMVHDLSSLFEAAGGLQMMGQPGNEDAQGSQQQGQPQGGDAMNDVSEATGNASAGSTGGGLSSEEGLSNILKELF